MSEYKADSIRVLEGLEAVRLRPGMYIGTTSLRGLHHLIWEVVDNSIDEVMAGYGKEIKVTIKKNNTISVTDFGRGIPVAKHPQTGLSTLETVLTVLHAGGKFDASTYKTSGGLHGVGASVVNALSSHLKATVWRDGQKHVSKFEKGIAQGEMVSTPTSRKQTGTEITFTPDYTIMEPNDFDFDTINERLKHNAFLLKGLIFTLVDERTNTTTTHQYDAGLVDYMGDITQGTHKISPVIHDTVEKNDITVDFALQYVNNTKTVIKSYTNNIETKNGGTHVDGLKLALRKKFSKKNLSKFKETITFEDIATGLVAIISIRHTDPQFEGQTKDKLGSSDVKPIATELIYQSIDKYFDTNPNVFDMVVKTIHLAQTARLAAKKARDNVNRKSVFNTGSLPGKLTDCSSTDPDKTELFIVEGDSAGGSAKMGRDRFTQAILPLRGKVLNTQSLDILRILENTEIMAMINAIGCGIGEDFDITKIRYNKIIIMTDADVDGAHIGLLLLTFFWNFMPELIKHNKIWIAQPPLYKLTQGKKSKFVYKEEEKVEAFKNGEFDPDKTIAQRFKGLGEMDAEQLWDTTLDPERRSLIEILLSEDDTITNKTFEALMGSNAEPRKKLLLNTTDGDK